ncbi:hypothetical protein ABZT02_40705 [Streptomyces sp. NPDC005402]
MTDESDTPQANTEDSEPNASETDQDDFDEIAAVKDSILEGVITYW